MPNNNEAAQRESFARIQDAQKRLVDLETKEYLTAAIAGALYAPIPEIGTWTPLVSDSAAAGGNLATTTTAYGTYVKIGPFVYTTAHLAGITTTGMTAGNPVRVHGLPFEPNTNASWRNSAVAFSTFIVASNGPLMASISASPVRIGLSRIVSAAGATQTIVSDLTSGTATLRITTVYETD